MADLLYLTHRLPYPPDKGDKITTFNFLRHLATKHRVHLGCFVDSETDWSQVGELKRWCASHHLVRIEPRHRKPLAGRALLLGGSISEVYHRDAGLQRWVTDTVQRLNIRHGLAYCSAMGPYLEGAAFAGLRRVTHYADVDSAKWQSYAEQHSGLMGYVYGREARELLAMERRVSAAYDITSFVSDADAALYRQLAPESADKVRVIPNGVDTDYFTPALDAPSPYRDGAQAIVFTGAMDYWPNGDAVAWFAQEVFPRVRAAAPEAEFWIVGSNPPAAVQALAQQAGVHVTGRVPDVRPYLLHSRAVVAPLRVARGVQNKVLEAYAMARNVLLTPSAANGLQPAPFIAEQTHESPEALAAATVAALGQPPRFDAARQYVMDRYSWQYAFDRLDEALQ